MLNRASRIAAAAAFSALEIALFQAMHVSAQTLPKPTGCVTCHAALPEAALSSPAKAVAGDVHDKAGVHCSDCHGGDPTATDKDRAHDAAHGYRGKPSGATICATCHVLLADKFKTSVHAQVLDRACVDCHGNHGVRPPSDAMLGTAKDAICSACHSDRDDPGFVAAGKMRASIDRLTQGIEASSDLMARVRNAGMEVGDEELALAQARTTLVSAKTEMHAFDPATLDAVVDDGMKSVTTVNQGSNRALSELAFRRRGLFVALGAILLMVIALAFKIRDLNRRHQSPG